MAFVSADALENARSETMGLMLTQLKHVARTHKMPVSGAKAVLQERIKDKLSEHARRNDAVNFHLLVTAISDPDGSRKNDDSSTLNPTAGSQAMFTMGGGPFSSPQSNNYGQVRPNFKDSPFFVIQSAVTPVQECKVRETTRDSFECKIRISPELSERFAAQRSDENLKFMIYCASEPISPFVKVDIAFPSQIEIKVNGNEVKANLRGLKNKPGSTRPADISDLIHKKPNYTNSMTVTYALTLKKFYLVVNLINQIKPENLVQDLQMRSSILKDQVIREMVNRSQDTDIQTTSSIMSLKCPLSTLRMEVPCRSTVCAHNQCYDAISFLQLQEQAPTWTCPVCSKPVAFESLHIDEYVNEILSSTIHSIDQVMVEPDGKWSTISPDESQPRGTHSSGEEDDDLIEIDEPAKIRTMRADSLLTPSSMGRTPPHSSREPSIASMNTRNSGNKRPASAVIDLTFSSDEDDQPNASKRHTMRQVRQYKSFAVKDSESSRASGVSFSIPPTTGRPLGHMTFGSGS